jgi:hypothetical protein
MYTKTFMAHQQKPMPRLFLRSDWTPPIHLINRSLTYRINNFTKRVQLNYIKRKTGSNLLPFQRKILAELRTSKKFLVIQADKNLGPAIIERDVYIRRALHEHLQDRNTYQQLSKLEAYAAIQRIHNLLESFMARKSKQLDSADVKYLSRTFVVEDPFPKFYLTAKVHKNPWKTRPIVSVQGSLLHGLGRWVDKVLQPFARATTAFTNSSLTLKDEILALGPLPKTALLITTDAVSMYTNIETKHALTVIKTFVHNHPQHASTSERYAVVEALELLMTNNVVQFGDTYWKQINGTAMGVSPSCVYATLYFAAFEDNLVKEYPEIIFYRRYIDDVFIIWVPRHNPEMDLIQYNNFRQALNSFGKLRWEFSTRSNTANFLDLTITLNSDGKISTKIFEKPENLYLYLPATSSHPFSNLKGLVHGMVYRTLRLTSNKKDQHRELNNLFLRLKARGYAASMITDIITKSYNKINSLQSQNLPNAQADVKDMNTTCFFHLPYHPKDPKSNLLQTLFREEMIAPKGAIIDLPRLRNHKGHLIGINRMIVAYHRTPNIGNLLSPRIMKAKDSPPVSSYTT